MLCNSQSQRNVARESHLLRQKDEVYCVLVLMRLSVQHCESGFILTNALHHENENILGFMPCCYVFSIFSLFKVPSLAVFQPNEFLTQHVCLLTIPEARYPFFLKGQRTLFFTIYKTKGLLFSLFEDRIKLTFCYLFCHSF